MHMIFFAIDVFEGLFIGYFPLQFFQIFFTISEFHIDFSRPAIC